MIREIRNETNMTANRILKLINGPKIVLKNESKTIVAPYPPMNFLSIGFMSVMCCFAISSYNL